MSATNDFVPIEIPLEDVVIGTIKQMRDVDERLLRLRWRESEGRPIEVRVRDLVGGTGMLYDIVMNTIAQVLR